MGISSLQASIDTVIKRHSPYYVAAVVAIATLVVYLPALQNGFINWDDDVYVVNKYQIMSLDPAFFKWAFTDLSLGFWHPITWISYAVDYAVWGLNPLGYHLTAIILHALNTFLVVLLIVRLLSAANSHASPLPSTEGIGGRREPLTEARFPLIIAGVTGVLFGIHPMHVESVAWIAERKDLLCALFFLLSVMTYINYVVPRRDRGIHEGQGSFILDRYYLLSFAFFILALASKTMAVSLPVVLLILDWYPLKRARRTMEWKRLFVEKIPFIGLSLITSIVSILSQKAYGALSHIDAPLSSRVLVASRSLVMYLGKMVFPYDLLPLYAYPKNASLFAPEYFLAIIIVVVITGASIHLMKKRPLWLSIWTFYLITLLPVLGIVQVGFFPMADRFTYLPSLGPFLLAGSGAAWIWAKADSLKKRNMVIKGLAVILAVSLCIVMSFITLKQMAIWKDSITFWSYVIEKEPNSHPVAYHNRGLAFKNAGQLERALGDISAAIAREDKGIANIYNSRGSVFGAMGRQDEALEDLNKAIALDPGFADAYTNRGMAFQNMGQTDRAMADFDRAIQLDPGQYPAYYYRGKTYQESGRPDLAIEDLTRAITQNPFFAQAYVNRGLAFEQIGRTDVAFEDYTSAINADPSFANAYNNRGLLFEKAGRLDEALKDLNKAIALNPKSIEAYNNRGLVYEDMGRFDKAIEDYSGAIVINPSDYLSYSNRGIAMEKTGRTDAARKDHQRACDLGYKVSCDTVRTLGGKK